MEEAQASQINGDEFYETIEAPKFVDFTSPDQPHPDDRYWFCLRVGCDQKHEEELDSEAIYKNFVLRVMAARSPNVRLRKALCRKPQSLKCPLTAPSKSRISRLALITSISHKIVDVKDRGRRPISKISATPKANSKQSCAATAKSLTTPRNRKQISNPDTFRSVRNPKDTNIAVPKNKLVAKALVFHSPKKAVKTKTSLKLNSPVRKICAAMKKLEIAGDKNLMENNKSLPLHSTAKQKRGRKVESRVFDLLHPLIQKDQEAKPSKCTKRKNKEKKLKQSCGPEAHEQIEIDKNDKKVEESSECASVKACSSSSPSKNGEVNDLKTTKIEHHDEVLSEASESGYNNPKFKATVGPVKKINDAGDKEDQLISSSKDIISNSEDIDNDDKENALAFGTEENGQVIDSDDKENASASDDNREMEGKDLSNHDTSTKTQQVKRVTNKTLKKSFISASSGPQEVKYRKPKPTTNPKPFRLRTGERGILKEANLEKKLLTPLKEITSVGLQGGKSMRNHKNAAIHERGILKEANLEKKLLTSLKEITSVGLQGGKSMRNHKNAAIHKNENCLRQNEYESYTIEDNEKRIDRTTHVDQPGRFRTTTTKQDLEKGASVTTPRTCTISMKQKVSLVNSIKEESQVLKCEDSLDKTKSPVMRKKLATPQGFSSRKAIISYKKNGQRSLLKKTSSTILRTKEAVKMCNNDASPTTKASSSTKYRSASRGKRPVTIPKEPNFHSIHVPKSCTRKMT